MVGQRILAPLIEVRVLAPQQRKKRSIFRWGARKVLHALFVGLERKSGIRK